MGIRLSDFIVICCLARIIVRKFDGPPVCFSIHLSLSHSQCRNNPDQITIYKHGAAVRVSRWANKAKKFRNSVAESLIRICSLGATNFGAAKSIRCVSSLAQMKSVTENSPDFNILVSAHTGAFFFSLSFRFQSGWKLSYVCWPAGKISREGGAVGMISTARRSLARSDRRFSTGCWLNSPLELCDPMGQREREREICVFRIFIRLC
jgi:hypothetical protein